MTMTEKVAYLKGLAEELGLDASKKETRVINAIIDVLEEMSASVTDCEDDIISLGEEVDELSESVSELEDVVYGDEDDEDDEDDDDEDDDSFEFTCPQCGEKLYLDVEAFEAGSVTCKACGRVVEFEIVDSCGCEDCESCLDDEDPDVKPEV